MSSNAYDMGAWPPSETSFLSGLQRPSAQAIIKHIERGCVSGMTYRIDAERVFLKDKPHTLYFVQIDSWEYTIRNDSIETPVLSFTYLENAPLHDKPVKNVHVMGKKMRSGYRLSEKTLRIAAYLTRQIAQGHVPDAQRVLSSYKFLPTHPMVPGFFHDSFSYANGLLKERS